MLGLILLQNISEKCGLITFNNLLCEPPYQSSFRMYALHPITYRCLLGNSIYNTVSLIPAGI